MVVEDDGVGDHVGERVKEAKAEVAATIEEGCRHVGRQPNVVPLQCLAVGFVDLDKETQSVLRLFMGLGYSHSQLGW